MNYTKQPKKLLIMNILEILKEQSDENHRLSQRDIIDILEGEYNMTADRKAVRRNILNLIDFGYEIEYRENLRMVVNPKTGKKEESYIMSDFYLVKDFDDSELRLLIDSLLFSKHIPYAQCKALVKKLEGLSNRYFLSRVKHISTFPETASQNKQLFYTIDVLDEAITERKKVTFCYNRYGTDKKLHPIKNKNGGICRYTVNPYQMAATNGRYYLICNYDNYDDVANIRLDRITEIKLTDDTSKPMKDVKGLENGLDLPRHMAEHIYMFSGESVNVTFTAKKYIINDIIDWFGHDIIVFNETDDSFSVSVRVNTEAMRRFALQYALHIRIVSPDSLVEQVEKDIAEAMENYKG